MTTNENPARAQAAANTVKLIEWAAEAVKKPLPEPVRRRAAIILSDDIGAMVAGSLEAQVARAHQAFLKTSSGSTEATVLARGAPKADKYTAASANGMAITWCELDEGFRNASCHGGAYTIPALLAESEAQGRTVEEVLRALAVAYEVTTRFALAFPFPVFNVHPHAAFAAIGGAAAASLARRQDADTMLAAVTGGASMSFAGPFDTAVEGALIRNAWTSAGAWLGLRAADWAEAGIGGKDVTP
jgi:2-methylcitrate dehydratase PrpD